MALLALPARSAGDSQLIDALPYYDTISAEEKTAVNALIEEEMRRSSKQPADYLAELPPLPVSRLQDDEILQSELQRAAKGEAMPGLDTVRYNLNPPAASKRNDVSAWKSALANANSQLEHQYNRLLNLELLLKFGPGAWRMHNEGLAALAKQLEGQLADVRGRIDGLNRERKLQQTAAGREIGKLEAEYLELVHKNAEIDAACRQVEQQIARLQDALGGGSTAQHAEQQQQQADAPADQPAAAESPEPADDQEDQQQPEANGQVEVTAPMAEG